MANSISIDVIFNAINKTSNVFGQVNRGMNGMMNNMWKVNQAADLLGRTSDAINRISAPGESYDFGLAELSAITGIAGQDLTDLGKMARKVGKDSGLGATGALEAYKLLASQIEVDKIGLKGLNELQKSTIILAQGSKELGLAGSANALAGTINQFGYQADQANRVMNVLAAGSKYGAAEVPDLAASFKIVGASAAAAGLEVEDTAGAIEILSKNNLKGSEAGTAFRNVLLKMQTELGFDFKVTKLSDALKTLQGREGDAAYMSKIFGMENITAAQFLVKNASAVKEMTRKVTNTTVATEQADIMNKTFTHRMDVMKAKLNDLSIGFFQHNQGMIGWLQIGGQAAATFTALSPIIAGTGKVITGSVSGLLTFTKASRLMNAAVAAGKLDVAAGLMDRYGAAGRWAAIGIKIKANAVAGALWVGKLFNAETRKATLLQLWNGTVTKAQAAWTWTLAGAHKMAAGTTLLWNRAMAVGSLTMKGVIATTWAWTAALWANPITWIVAAVLALVAALLLAWKHFDWLRGGIVGAWEGMKKFGEILFGTVLGGLKQLLAGIGKIGQAIALLFKGQFGDAWKTAKDGFGDIAGGSIKMTPVGIAMETVKRRDEIGAAVRTGYDKGKNIDTSNFLNFKPKSAEMPDLGKMGGMMNPQAPKGKVVDMWPVTDNPVASAMNAQVNPVMQQPTLGAMNAQVNPVMQQPSLDAMNAQVNPVMQQPSLAAMNAQVNPVMQQPSLGAMNAQVNPVMPTPENINLTGKIVNLTMPTTKALQIPGIITASNPALPFTQPESKVVPFANQPAELTKNIELATTNITRNIATTNVNNSTTRNAEDSRKIEVNYQPQVHVSAAMTQEDRDAVMKILATDKDKLMQLIKEELRKERRLAYAG